MEKQLQFKVINNNGCQEKLTNQCMWISILNYLERKGYQDLTLMELRAIGKLGDDSKHEMFDIMKKKFKKAINAIATVFDLKINFYAIDHDGVARSYTIPEGCINPVPGFTINRRGNNIVSIAQFGTYHFELITSGYDVEVLEDGEYYRPTILVDKKITYVDKFILPKNLMDLYMLRIEKSEFVEFLQKDIKNNENNLHRLFDILNETSETIKFVEIRKGMKIEEKRIDQLLRLIHMKRNAILQETEEIKKIDTKIGKLEA